MGVPQCTVEVSHDGSTWTDVSAWWVTTGIGQPTTFRRGRSKALGEWEAGGGRITFHNQDRGLDRRNNDATFGLRQGDWIRIRHVTTGYWLFEGWIDSVRTANRGNSPDRAVPTITVSFSDAVARLQRKHTTITALGDDDQALSSAHLTATLSQVGYTNNQSVATGTVYCSNAGRGSAGNALAYFQQVTRTEGGAARLYSSRAGTLTWKARTHRASQTVAFGAGGIVCTRIDTESSDDEWANYVTVTPAAHTDTFSSSSSVAIGTGSKTFTVVLPVAPCTAGATVVATATAGATGTMTGTVTSCSTTSLVINVTSTTGSGTGTAWSIATTEPGDAQSAFDEQSYDATEQFRARSVSTLHPNRTLALTAACALAAQMSVQRERITGIEVSLEGVSSAQVTSVFGLEIGDAAEVVVDHGVGDPQVQTEIRFIDGCEHVIAGRSHKVRFTLGMVATMNITSATVKQPGTIASTLVLGQYAVDDAGWCSARIAIAVTAAGSAGNAIVVTVVGLPAPLSGMQDNAGTFTMIENGAPNRTGVAYWDGADLKMIADNSSNYVGSNPSTALANGDYLHFNLHFPTV